MIDRLADVPLGEIGEDGPLWEDHPQHRVNVFDTGFLVASHRVTIIDLCAGIAVTVEFQRFRITKLAAAVSQ